MRSALRPRESDVKYREVADHFARLDIHPGYLAALGRSASPHGPFSPEPISHVSRRQTMPWLDYVAFGVALGALLLSLGITAMYLNRSVVQTTVGIPSPLVRPNTDIVRLEDSVRKLSIALASVVNRIEQGDQAHLTTDAPIVEVVVPKANLRVAPLKNSSTVMAVSAGTRLVVDSKENDWLRVFSPTGELLYISADLVTDR